MNTPMVRTKFMLHAIVNDNLAVPCPRHSSELFTKQHAIYCLNIHHRLQIPETTTDPLSFLLNRLLNSKPRSRQAKLFGRPSGLYFALFYNRWAISITRRCRYNLPTPGKSLIDWLCRSRRKCY
ncbi:hypothetical protein BCV71DRAFT_255302 [Rhizopus microsporus]|uniref:Uncharacterized protein n=1 Tax=Rhizopus microsporus TaxID=58291 RepID=A0A1X0S348_RHIZD|nr:hypothetical protein BCV71DRAFT_255302 [Rhizopus microsporus]